MVPLWVPLQERFLGMKLDQRKKKVWVALELLSALG
jgi:hypothetical protein